MVGGTGGFPLVSRILRTTFGERRVKRSPHPFAATAIGLAVFLDTEVRFRVVRTLFATFRGLPRGAGRRRRRLRPDRAQGRLACPPDGRSPLVVSRTYRAAHNIGHFRFVECSRLVNGRPDGDVVPYDPVLFPFDPALHDRDDLGRQPVGRWSDGPEVEERYVVAPSGAVEVTLTTQPAGFKRTFRLERRRREGGVRAMELYDVMRTTFAAREFTDDPLPDDVLRRIFDNARFAPSGGNRQGAHITVVRDADVRRQLAELGAPAARRYFAQLTAGENPWNSVHPSEVPQDVIDSTEIPDTLHRADHQRPGRPRLHR